MTDTATSTWMQEVDGEFVLREGGAWFCSCSLGGSLCTHKRTAMKMFNGSATADVGTGTPPPGTITGVVEGGVEEQVPVPVASTPLIDMARTLDMLNPPNHPPLPEWVEQLHDHQWDAVESCMELFRAGVRVVWLDAPTGSGKTLIGEAVRRVQLREGMIESGLYVCSDKSLQDQFLRDFDYASVLKGRANYPTLNGSSNVDCSDCTNRGGAQGSCNWCDNVMRCPYQLAKGAAVRNPLAVLNTAYLLAEGNTEHGGSFSDRGLAIMDECDTLENVLMGYVQFTVTDRTAKDLKVEAPKKGSHHKTLVGWIDGELREAVDSKLRVLSGERSLFGDLKHSREVKKLQRLKAGINNIIAMAGEGNDNWVRDNDDPMTLKPVKVDLYGEDLVWGHAARWLCMSATVISPEQMVDALGVQGEEGEVGGWGVVRVPMTFPVQNRPVFTAAVANMVQKEKETAWPKMVQGIRGVVSKYPEDRILIHAVSYALSAEIASGLSGMGRRVIAYTNAYQKEAALEEFRRTDGAVLIASSMERGVDLKGDDCRVQIIAKCPYPYLGNPQVGKRMKAKGGEEWYAVTTVRSIVQMTGRGVRNKDDWCDTYILDAQFSSNVLKRNRRLFPKWWLDALETVRASELVKAGEIPAWTDGDTGKLYDGEEPF